MMYLDFNQLYEKYDAFKNIIGVIHVGACTGEEREVYSNNNIEDVLWFEANPETYEILCKNINKYEKNQCFNVLLSDKEGEIVDFYVTSNFRAASSSMLKLKKHIDYYPEIKVEKTLHLETKTLKNIIENNVFDLKKYNFLNMDVQGSELKVLKGLDCYINDFDYIYSEINIEYLYENCVLLSELEEYLKGFGFSREETNITKFGWGDALFVKGYR